VNNKSQNKKLKFTDAINKRLVTRLRIACKGCAAIKHNVLTAELTVHIGKNVQDILNTFE